MATTADGTPIAVTEHIVTHSVDEGLMNGLVMLIAELRIANRFAGNTPEPATVPAGCDHEPWTFRDPKPPHDDMVAFLDDRQQVRYIPTARANEVPRHWRRVLLAPARGEDDA